jgi:hypothetical protein
MCSERAMSMAGSQATHDDAQLERAMDFYAG